MVDVGDHCYRIMRGTLWWSREPTATTCNHRSCHITKMIEGERETFCEWRKHTRITHCGIQPLVCACPYGLLKQTTCYRGSIHGTSRRESGLKDRRVDFHGRINFRRRVVLGWGVGGGGCYRSMMRNREPVATRCNRCTCYPTRVIGGQPGTFGKIEKTYRGWSL